MGLIARGDNTNYEPAPAGTHRAVCTGLVDLGTQDGNFGEKPQILITWEIDEERDDGERHRVHARLNPSLNPKAKLRGFLDSWRKTPLTDEEVKEFNLRAILGKPCLVTVVHRKSQDGQRVYANVTGVSALPKGTQPLKPSSPPVFFDLDDPDLDLFDRFSEHLKETIRKAPEWDAAHAPIPPAEDEEPPPHTDDDIPF